MSADRTWHKVAGAGELTEGTLKSVTVAEKPLVIAHCEGRYGALDDRCPHAGGPLSQGHIENGRLVCPWHGREFHPATGECDGYLSVAAYPVEARDDGIYVAL